MIFDLELASVIQVIATGAALVWVAAMLLSERYSALDDRLTISRYPMFAARDELVRLVAEKRMDPASEAWRETYLVVNRLLRMHRDFDALNVTKGYLRFVISYIVSRRVRADVAQMEKKMRAVEKRVPEFRAVRAQISVAFQQMVGARTRLRHRIAFGFYRNFGIRRDIERYVHDLAKAELTCMEPARVIARRTRKKTEASLRHPSADKVFGFAASSNRRFTREFVAA